MGQSQLAWLLECSRSVLPVCEQCGWLGTALAKRHVRDVAVARCSPDSDTQLLLMLLHADTVADCEFLKKWTELVDLEEGDILTRRAEIWSVPGGKLLAGCPLPASSRFGSRLG
jgi:hypothetical protein